MISSPTKKTRDELEAESAQRAAHVSSLQKGANIHIAGVCGTGMAAVLTLLKQLGFRVSGSDIRFYPPMGEVVRALCDKLYEGYAAENLLERPDLVVIGNSLGANNPEVLETLRLGIPYASMPEVFSALLIGTREQCATSVVISGTHGKTTTTAATAWFLESAGKKPGFFIGGIPHNLPSGIRATDHASSPQNRIVVLEGDEYDSAYFAKWSKFHSYRPDILVITSLEFDHADIFADLSEIESEFTRLVEKIPASGTVFVCDTSHTLKNLAREWANNQRIKADIVFYGESRESKFSLLDRRATPQGQNLKIQLDKDLADLHILLPGPHNALNILAAAAVCYRLGLSLDEISQAAKNFRGVQRRQEIVSETRGITIIEDFAHHPTAVQLTLQGIRESFPGRRILVAFEPRSNTSRRAIFFNDYAKSFKHADRVFLLEIPNQAVYSKHKEPVVLLDVRDLAEAITSAGTQAESYANVQDIQNSLVDISRPGDVLIIMSNGDFGGLIQTLPNALEGN